MSDYPYSFKSIHILVLYYFSVYLFNIKAKVRINIKVSDKNRLDSKNYYSLVLIDVCLILAFPNY